MRTLFEGAGAVVLVTMPTDRDSGRPRGFAFVEMSTGEQAAEALQKFNGFALNGRAIRVNEATERPTRTGPWSGGSDQGQHRSFAPGPRKRPKGSRRNLRARKRSL